MSKACADTGKRIKIWKTQPNHGQREFRPWPAQCENTARTLSEHGDHIWTIFVPCSATVLSMLRPCLARFGQCADHIFDHVRIIFRPCSTHLGPCFDPGGQKIVRSRSTHSRNTFYTWPSKANMGQSWRKPSHKAPQHAQDMFEPWSKHGQAGPPDGQSVARGLSTYCQEWSEHSPDHGRHLVDA